MTPESPDAPRRHDLQQLATQAALRTLRGQELIPPEQLSSLLQSRTRFSRPPLNAPRLLRLLWAHAETRPHQHEHLTSSDWKRVLCLLRELSCLKEGPLTPLSKTKLTLLEMVSVSQNVTSIGHSLPEMHSDEQLFWSVHSQDQDMETALALRVLGWAAQAAQPLTPLKDQGLLRVLGSHHAGLRNAGLAAPELTELIGPPSYGSNVLSSLGAIMGQFRP